MEVDTVVKNFITWESDNEVTYQEKYEETDDLPMYMKETIRFLEEEQFENKEFFRHILAKLSFTGFKSRYYDNSSTYEIATSKGKIVLMS